MNLAKQIDTNSETTHRLSTLTTKVDDKVLSPSLAEDVYHKGEHIPKNDLIYSRPMEMQVFGGKLTVSEAFKKSEQTLYNELTDQLNFIRPQFNKVRDEIENDLPALKDKDWGYSVDKKGKLIALGNISEDERSFIEEKLNQDDRFVRLNQNIPETLTKGLEYERAATGSSKHWGKYDVTSENFKDVIDMKSLLKSTEGAYADTFYNNVDFFSYEKNMTAQLAKNAEIKYYGS